MIPLMARLVAVLVLAAGRSRTRTKPWTTCGKCQRWCYNWRLHKQGYKCECVATVELYGAGPPAKKKEKKEEDARASSDMEQEQDWQRDATKDVSKLQRIGSLLCGLLDENDPLTTMVRTKINETAAKAENDKPMHIRMQACESKLAAATSKIASIQTKLEAAREKVADFEEQLAETTIAQDKLVHEKRGLEKQLRPRSPPNAAMDDLLEVDTQRAAQIVAGDPDLQVRLGRMYGLMADIRRHIPAEAHDRALEAMSRSVSPAGAAWNEEVDRGGPLAEGQRQLPFAPARGGLGGGHRHQPYEPRSPGVAAGLAEEGSPGGPSLR